MITKGKTYTLPKIACLFTIIIFTLLFTLLPARIYSELIDSIAAVVNDRSITMAELKNEMVKLAPVFGFKTQDRGKLLANKDLRKRTLDHMVNEMLIEDEIKKRGIVISDTELDMFIRDIMKRNGLKSIDELVSALSLQGMTLGKYKEAMKKQLARSKMMNFTVHTKVNISEQDLKNYYMQHMDEVRDPDTLHLKNIFINKGKENDTKKKNKAKGIIKRLRRGENFGKLVKKYSEDANAKTGGDLGFLTAKDINPRIYEEVMRLKAGEHTGIIDAEGGYYIIKLVETKKGQIKNFESVKDDLKNKLTTKELESKFKGWLEDLKSQSHIDIKI